MPKQDITIVGLGQARRELRDLDKALPRELGKGLKGAVDKAVLPTAKQLAPVRSGRLQASLRPFARGTRAGVRSNLVYANPIHWGWPRHNITADRFLLKASARTRDRALEEIEDTLDDMFSRHGFKR